ncbi:gamma carbonic anhydrase family protein [candidate division WOR-3 bacterium]|nr:gamma carbonic anhydrase family protein [candidate division WOR-3 bacterium]
MQKKYLSDKSVLEGDVRLGENANVWPCAVLRGDINYIQIGENTNIQDGCLVHVTHELPVVVGKNVTVGHGAIIHGCVIGDNILIGMGAIILDGAKINDNSIVAAGSVVLENQEIPKNSLVAGIPAKIKRQLTDKEVQKITESAVEYVKLAKKSLVEISLKRQED